MTMRVVDLSMPVRAHFRWPVATETLGDFERGDQYVATRLSMSVHAFTHVDAVSHIVPGGATTDDIAIDQVVGPARVVDLAASVGPSTPIDAAMMAAAAPDIGPGDRVLMKTAWDRHRSPADRAFWMDSPWLAADAVEWLRERRIRAIAFDFPQDHAIRRMMAGERVPFEEHHTHHRLLRDGVALIEYVCNTAELREPRVLLCAAPLKVARADGAPARVYAIEGL